MPNKIGKKRPMATSPVKNRSALDVLLDSMDNLAVSASEKMAAEELRETRKEINETVDRVVSDGRKRRQQTA